jgi:hypothetical protein
VPSGGGGGGSRGGDLEINRNASRGGGRGDDLELNKNSRRVPPFVSVKSGGGEPIRIVIAGKHYFFLK